MWPTKNNFGVPQMDIVLKDVNYGDTTTVRVHFDRPGHRIVEVKVAEQLRPETIRLDEKTVEMLQRAKVQQPDDESELAER